MPRASMRTVTVACLNARSVCGPADTTTSGSRASIANEPLYAFRLSIGEARLDDNSLAFDVA
jgi:hypothetical protein